MKNDPLFCPNCNREATPIPGQVSQDEQGNQVVLVSCQACNAQGWTYRTRSHTCPNCQHVERHLVRGGPAQIPTAQPTYVASPQELGIDSIDYSGGG